MRDFICFFPRLVAIVDPKNLNVSRPIFFKKYQKLDIFEVQEESRFADNTHI